MTTLTQFQSDEIASGHRIYRCKFCREQFGTVAALKLHNPAPAPARFRQIKSGTVKRSLCRNEKTMIRAGAWRGYSGIWWTPDGGWADDIEDLPFPILQAIETSMVILDKNGGSVPKHSKKRKPHNGAGFSGSVSKFREGQE